MKNSQIPHIKLLGHLRPHELEGFVCGHGFFVGTVVGEGTEDVDDHRETGKFVDLVTLETHRIAFPVEFFVVLRGDKQRSFWYSHVLQKIEGCRHVSLEDSPFFGIRLSWLIEDFFRDNNFTSIVDDPAVREYHEFFPVQS